MKRFHTISFFLWCLFFCGFLFVGCRPSKPEAPSSYPIPPHSVGSEMEEESSQEDAPAPSQAPIDHPERKEGISSEQILREMLDVYRQAKLYSDHGEVRIVSLTKENKKIIERIPCSVTLRKPNNVRLEIGGGVLTCDGEKFRAKLLDHLHNHQVLERNAPLLFSSISEFYPDVQLADAMDLTTPTDLFWTAPQLILLYAREPLKTFVSHNTRPKLLDPEWFEEPDFDAEGNLLPDPKRTACDRVAVSDHRGTVTYWISRETHGLLRVEIPLEQFPVNEQIKQVLSVSIDFPNQVISNDPSQITMEPDLFVIPPQRNEEVVDKFLPPDIMFLGQKAKNVRLLPLFDGFSGISLDHPSELPRIICFWGGNISGNQLVWERSQAFLQEFQRSYQTYDEKPDIEFLAVNAEPISRRALHIRSDYGATGSTVPLYDLEVNTLARTPLRGLSVPSIMLVDAEGIIQLYLTQPTPFIKLQYLVEQLRNGVSLYQKELVEYERTCEQYRQALQLTDTLDLYRTETTKEPEKITPSPIVHSQNFTIVAEWKLELLDVASPLAYSTSEDSGTAIIPCEGNALAVVDERGQLIRKRILETAAGEPIRFLRTFVTQGGTRYFVASSFLDTYKLHLLDQKLEIIGTLDFTRQSRFVADAFIIDSGDDERPEVILSLAGDSASNLIPVHGIYAVDVLPDQATNGFLWSDENVVAPNCLGVWQDRRGNSTRILGLNYPTESVGQVVIDDPNTGERLAEINPPEGGSILWFAADPDRDDRIAAIISRDSDKRNCFALINTEGEILSQTPIDGSWNGNMSRIIPFDLDDDGTKEWIVPTQEGLIYFFKENGELFDRFCRGEEITGMCAVKWRGRARLVISSPEQVTSNIVTFLPKE